jgi:3-isopropylmalate/(R)-2-methylmalate dehydratase large subunit
MTLCNLSIELGAKVGMIAPDETTFRWLKDKPFAPKGAQWDLALAAWRQLADASNAEFDREEQFDCDALAPQMTWGTSPEQVGAIDRALPVLADQPDADKRQAWRDALEYMGLHSGQSLAGTKIDRVFIGSCTNSRLSDLRAAAQIVGQQRVASHVRAWVVPGSMRVKQAAEAEGLDHIFLEAGFDWREPGCSLCVGANGEFVEPQARCISTSNRNFVGRQGPRSRTHLASPVSAAAAAIAGEIIDPRRI